MTNRARAGALLGAVICATTILCLIAIRALAANDIPLRLVVSVIPCRFGESQSRSACYSERLSSAHPATPVPVVFRFIRLVQPYDPVLKDCHFIAHRIGEAVVRDDPRSWRDALVAEGTDTLCSYGYTHGLSAALYADGDLSDEGIRAELEKLRGACDDPDAAYLARGNCAHGIGHMLYALSQADVAASLSMCDEVVSDGPIREELLRFCFSGVIMNLFIPLTADGESDWRRLTNDTAPQFCMSLSEDRHREACRRGSWILQADEMAEGRGIVEFCDVSSNDDARRLCYGKVFHGLAWKLVSDPERMAALCTKMSGGLQDMCASSATNEIVLTFGGRAGVMAALDFCALMPERVSVSCETRLAAFGRHLYREAADRMAYCAPFDPDLRKSCIDAPFQ